MTNCFVASAFPTLKYFIKGLPTDYTGPLKADGIITHLRRLSAPSIEQLNSEAELHGFVKSIGTEIPLFIGFGLKATDLEEFANKYRSKAWFAVMETFSEEIMEDFNFDKGPALVVTRGEHGEKTTFYGPFEGQRFLLYDLEASVKSLDLVPFYGIRQADFKLCGCGSGGRY